MDRLLDWVTIKEFEKIEPVSLYHKEQDVKAQERVKSLQVSQKNVHILFRSSFVYAKEEDSAILYITGDDYYKLYINGIFVTQGPAPAYPEKYYYNRVNIKDFLVEGENQIAVHLYYQGLINRVWNSGDNRCALGTKLKVGEKNVPLEWFYRKSKAFSGEVIGYDTQFLEDFDGRLWEEDWKINDYKEAGYLIAAIPNWIDYNLIEQPTKQLEIYEVIPEIVENKKDNQCNKMFIDFGKEIVGTLIIKANGVEGETVTIRFGEELIDSEEKAVRYQMRCNCKYEEKWTLKDDFQIYEGFDYKAFRYVELIYREGVEILDVFALMRHYPFDDNYCLYKGRDEKLKAIFELCKYTIKVGTQENYVDCPTREKGQYLGDSIIAARAHVHLTGQTQMLRKCIDQFAQTSKICTGLMAVAPGGLMQEIGDFSLLWSELLLTDYYFTKDKEFLKEYYPVAKGIIKHFEQYENEEGLLDCVADKWNLVDWPENLRDDYDFGLTRPVVEKGCHNVINALYLGSIINLIRIQSILGIGSEIDIDKKIKIFNDAFWDEKTGLYRDSTISTHSSLHSNVYPYYFGLTPKEKRATIGHFIKNKNLNCGVFLSYYAIKGLINNNKKDEAYDLLINEGEHSWMNMIKEGATTAFEAWGKDQKWNTSLCHPWACGPVSIILEDFNEME